MRKNVCGNYGGKKRMFKNNSKDKFQCKFDLFMSKHFKENILGIDYGDSDVGLALASSGTGIAFAYKTLKNDKNFLQKIAEIIEKENIKTVVLGVPAHINRKEAVYPSEKLGNWIAQNFGVNVFYQDEMFTTKMAQANLINKGIKKIKRFDDQEAARIILQEWLDNN